MAHARRPGRGLRRKLARGVRTPRVADARPRARGGRSESQWNNEFRTLTGRRHAIERALEDAGSGRTRRKAELRAAIDEVDRQLEVLEDEADDAHVPMRWRD